MYEYVGTDPGRGFPRVGVILVGLAVVLSGSGSAGAVQIEKTEVDLVIDPNSMSMTARVRLHVTDNTGDELFFQGFKRVFALGTRAPVTLDYFRECFESVHGAPLTDFFQRWYNEPGLPDN